jgi:hypothetical protein
MPILFFYEPCLNTRRIVMIRRRIGGEPHGCIAISESALADELELAGLLTAEDTAWRVLIRWRIGDEACAEANLASTGWRPR